MRTNIMLDDNLIERAQKLTGIKTKREVVQEALRTLVLLREQSEIRNFRGNCYGTAILMINVNHALRINNHVAHRFLGLD